MHASSVKVSLPHSLVRALALSALVVFSAYSDAQVVATPPGAGPRKASNRSSDEVVILQPFQVEAGFTGSLAAAAATKENASTIIEVIASEDIGKLPDISIADALTRLTGLTTERTNGRSQGISIRGLSGDFSTGMLNGREQVTTGLNRSVEFDQYPGELLNGVVVYKTGKSNLVGQGLAGTIDMQTVRPLSKPKRVIALSGYYEWTKMPALNAGSSNDGERANFSYIDQFADKKLGLALGFSHSDRPGQGQQWQAYGYQQLPAATDPNRPWILNGAKPYVRSSNLKRDGVMAVVEYKPSDRLHTVVDIYRSDFQEVQRLRGIEFRLASSSVPRLQPGYTVENGLVTKSTWTNVFGVARNDIVTRKNDIVAGGWNLKFGEGSGWTTVFDLGYSRIKRSDQNLETYSGTGFARSGAADTMTVTLGAGQSPLLVPTIDYTRPANLVLTDALAYGTGTLPATGQAGYLKYFQSKDELTQTKLFTGRDLHRFFSHMEIGVSNSDRYKRDGENPTGFIYPANGQSTLPFPTSIGVTNLSFVGIPGVASYDPLALFNSGAYAFLPNPGSGVIAGRWQVREKVNRAYLQLDIDSKIGAMPLGGNLGVQYNDVDQFSRGNSATGSGATLRVTPSNDGAKSHDWAPSLNMNLKPAERLQVRFSVARQIARPRMYDMRASRTFNYNAALAASTDVNTSPWSGDGGNPKLKPWRSNSVDLSIERYFRHNMGYVALAGFHKKLLSYIYQRTVLADFTGFPLATGATPPAIYEGKITTPVNGQGGTIRGLEATISLPSELFTQNIRGFGVVMGGAYTESRIEPWGPGAGTAPISGFSRKVANLTLYYERHGFSARVSERYRSGYRAFITNFGPPSFKGDVAPNTNFRTRQPEYVIDAQVGYAFPSGRLKGLSFFVQGHNLNDEPVITYDNNDPRLVRDYQLYGASYSVGTSYRF